jgi:hypothetical protein
MKHLFINGHHFFLNDWNLNSGLNLFNCILLNDLFYYSFYDLMLNDFVWLWLIYNFYYFYRSFHNLLYFYELL